jgi:hypothetical protein
MATWILIGGFVAVLLILGGAVLVVLWFTRDGTEDGNRPLPFKRFGAVQDEDPESTPSEG